MANINGALTGHVFYTEDFNEKGNYNDVMQVKESAQRIYNEIAYKKIIGLLQDTQLQEMAKHFTVDSGHSFAAVEFSKGVVYGISLFEQELKALKNMGDN